MAVLRILPPPTDMSRTSQSYDINLLSSAKLVSLTSILGTRDALLHTFGLRDHDRAGDCSFSTCLLETRSLGLYAVWRALSAWARSPRLPHGSPKRRLQLLPRRVNKSRSMPATMWLLGSGWFSALSSNKAWPWSKSCFMPRLVLH